MIMKELWEEGDKVTTILDVDRAYWVHLIRKINR